MNKEQLRARFERNLNGHFDIEKDEEGEYTNFNTVNMFASFLVGAAVARAEALEDAAKLCEKIADEYHSNEYHSYPELKTDAERGSYSCEYAIRALINKEQAQ